MPSGLPSLALPPQLVYAQTLAELRPGRTVGGIMAKLLHIVLFLCVAVTGAAAAQTSGASGTGLATPHGALQLPSTQSATQSTPSTATAGSAATPTVSSSSAGSGAGSGSARSGASTTAVSSGRSRAGGSAGGAGGSTSSGNVPDWLACPPSGASGVAPFLTGTSLSCAP